MNQELSIEHDGTQVRAEYCVEGDTLFIYLPNGETRSTELRGLDHRLAAETHLKSYVREVQIKKSL